MFAPISMSAAR